MEVVDLMSLQAWDKNGLCPLHIAIMLTKSVKLGVDGSSNTLAAAPAAVNASDAPLFILDMLLCHSETDPNVRTEEGFTPVMFATRLMLPLALRTLLLHNADIRYNALLLFVC
jgi:hypothetical protein